MVMMIVILSLRWWNMGQKVQVSIVLDSDDFFVGAYWKCSTCGREFYESYNASFPNVFCCDNRKQFVMRYKTAKEQKQEWEAIRQKENGRAP